MIVSVVVGVIYLLLATPKFTSSSSIYYQQTTPSLVEKGTGNTRNENFLNTEMGVIRSSTVLFLALGMPGMEELPSLRDSSNPVQKLKDGLDIEVGKKDDIITVSFSSPDREEARTIVASVVEAYQTFQSNQRKASLEAAEAERRKLNEQIAAKTAEMIAFKEKHGQLSFDDDKNNPLMQTVSRLLEALTAAKLETITTKTAYEEAAAALMANPELSRKLQDMSPSDAIGPTDPALLRTELFVLNQRIAEARRQYGDNHPAVRALNARAEQMTLAYVGAARERWLTAERREAELQRQFDEQQRIALQMQSVRERYTEMTKDRDLLRQRAEELSRRLKEIEILESAGALNISVLEPADLPLYPSSPKKTQVLAIALVGGFVIGLGFVFIFEWRDQRIRSAEEIKQALGVSVLGVVPAMPPGLTQTGRGMKVHVDPSSDVAEAYRTVRTAVYFGLPDENSKTILITSPSAGDGKSTLVSNLAIAMAQAGRRVLIVDADFRLPTQHKIFDLEPGAGLSSVLAGRAALESAILPTGVDKLDLLPCGPIPPNPSEILNSQSFSDVLGDLAAKYDHVLLDSPALMAVADARIASAWCDATLLVLHAERTNRRIALMARDGLVAVGANLVGVVVNDVDRDSDTHSFFTDFGYGAHKQSGAGKVGDASAKLRRSLEALRSASDR